MQCETCGQVRRAKVCGNARCKLSWPACKCTEGETRCTACRAGGDPDPIAELWWSLLRDGRPSLEWLIRWSVDGAEPVEAAWRASRDVYAMVNLLRFAGPSWIERLRAFRVRVWTRSAEDQARELIPQPPSLDALLETAQRRVRARE